MKKLNQTGTAHLLVGLFIVAVIGVIGTILLRQSHATPACVPYYGGSTKNYVIVSNSGQGAQPDIKIYAQECPANKNTGSYVNTISPVTVVSPNVNWNFCGHPQSSYLNTKLYRKNSNGQFVPMFASSNTGSSTVISGTGKLCRIYTTKTSLCNSFFKVTIAVPSASIPAYVTGCSFSDTYMYPGL
jgi:hypothetical protein